MKYEERPNVAVLLMTIGLVQSTELRGGIPQVDYPPDKYVHSPPPPEGEFGDQIVNIVQKEMTAFMHPSMSMANFFF